MELSENINTPSDKSDIPTSKNNFLHENLYDNHLLPSNELINKKEEKDKSISKRNINKLENDEGGTNSKKNKKNKADYDSFSVNKSLLLMDERNSIEEKNVKTKKNNKQKKYIVDNLDNIFSKLSEPKIKLLIQETLLYAIVFLVCIYYWIFLLISTSKMERNYCYTNLHQFDTCSMEQICNDYKSKLNIILYNSTYDPYNHSSKSTHEIFIEENKQINTYYRPFFLRYSNLLTINKMFAKIQMTTVIDKTNFVIILTHKEQWNLFLRYFSLCEFENYYVILVMAIAIGGSIGSLLFGVLSDIYGRRTIIRITLTISTITTIILYVMTFLIDKYYINSLNKYNENYKIIGEDTSYNNILSHIYAQERVRIKFRKFFIFYAADIFLLSSALWPLLKSCMALLVENSKGELEVLINFRRYNFAFGGLPPLFATLFFPNLNDFTLTFFLLSIFNIIVLICSFIFLDESVRYYYEYCEWEKLTEVILNTYKNNISEFRNLNEIELKEFQKEEDLKNFKNTARKMSPFSKDDNDNDNNENSVFIYRNTYYNDLYEKNVALIRNIKRNTDFVIKLNDVKSYPIILISTLLSNRSFKDSKFLILIILILLYIVMDLFQKQLLEPPFFTIVDLYIDTHNNYIINSVFFAYIIINFCSNYFYYGFYRISCFKTIIVFSQILISFNLCCYHIVTTIEKKTPMDLNEYNFNMISIYQKNKKSFLSVIFMFITYFFLNGVIFYVYLLILKISKTFNRCTFFSIHSISLIIAMVVSESIHYQMEHFFLFLCFLNLLCLITFAFLSEFKELLYIMNDLKIDIFRSSKNIQGKEKND